MGSVIRGVDDFDSDTYIDNIPAGLEVVTTGNMSWGSNGTYTTSHSLGRQPVATQIELVCVSSQHGYPTGAVLHLGSGERYSNWGVVVMNCTSSSIRWGTNSSGIIVRHHNSGSAQVFGTGNWRVRLRIIG